MALVRVPLEGVPGAFVVVNQFSEKEKRDQENSLKKTSTKIIRERRKRLKCLLKERAAIRSSRERQRAQEERQKAQEEKKQKAQEERQRAREERQRESQRAREERQRIRQEKAAAASLAREEKAAQFRAMNAERVAMGLAPIPLFKQSRPRLSEEEKRTRLRLKIERRSEAYYANLEAHLNRLKARSPWLAERIDEVNRIVNTQPTTGVKRRIRPISRRQATPATMVQPDQLAA